MNQNSCEPELGSFLAPFWAHFDPILGPTLPIATFGARAADHGYQIFTILEASGNENVHIYMGKCKFRKSCDSFLHILAQAKLRKNDALMQVRAQF